MSVGYDLAGIQTPKVAGFIDAMRNASAEIERLRPEIAADPSGVFAGFAAIEFPPVISDTVTLSTFHGCPPDEIEQITKHLIDAHDLDVIVKLNPTLLGPAGVAESCTVTSATTTCDSSRKPSRTTCISNGRSRSFKNSTSTPRIAAIGSASS